MKKTVYRFLCVAARIVDYVHDDACTAALHVDRNGTSVRQRYNRFVVAAFACELYVALNGDVCRADRLAGGGAALQDVASRGAVGDIVALCVPGDLTVGPVSVGDEIGRASCRERV